MLLIKQTATPSPFCTQAAAGGDLKSTFPNQLCVALAYANLRREDDSSDPKFQDATYALSKPLRLGTSASPVRRNAGSGRLGPEGSRGRGVEIVNNGGPASRDPPPTRRASQAAAPLPGTWPTGTWTPRQSRAAPGLPVPLC